MTGPHGSTSANSIRCSLHRRHIEKRHSVGGADAAIDTKELESSVYVGVIVGSAFDDCDLEAWGTMEMSGDVE